MCVPVYIHVYIHMCISLYIHAHGDFYIIQSLQLHHLLCLLCGNYASLQQQATKNILSIKEPYSYCAKHQKTL